MWEVLASDTEDIGIITSSNRSPSQPSSSFWYCLKRYSAFFVDVKRILGVLIHFLNILHDVSFIEWPSVLLSVVLIVCKQLSASS